MNRLLAFIFCILVVPPWEAWAGRKSSHIDVDPKPLVAQCHDLYSPQRGDQAYEPVNACLTKEIMKQARVLMPRAYVKSGKFEKELKQHIEARTRLYSASYDQCPDCLPEKSRTLFVQSEIERELVRTLARMIQLRNQYEITRHTPDH